MISSLTSGGAKKLYDSNKEYLSKHFCIKEIVESGAPSAYNFVSYLKHIYLYDNSWEKKCAEQIGQNDVSICYHSWITKSPNILRYLHNKSVYICHEPPREYHDNQHIGLQTTKEKIVNILRGKIKNIDINNVSHANVIVANSKRSQSIIKKIYGRDSVLIYPGVKNPKIKNSSTRSMKKIRLLTVGAINKLKNQLFILKVAKELANLGKSVELTIVANGCDKQYLKKLINESHGCNNLELIIKLNINDNKLNQIYSNSDCFLYAPINEPFGLVVLEAMNYGLPIFTNGDGGFSEVIGKNSGFIIQDESTSRWVEKIVNILDNKYLYKKISNNNISISRKFTEERMNYQLLSIIKHL